MPVRWTARPCSDLITTDWDNVMPMAGARGVSVSRHGLPHAEPNIRWVNRNLRTFFLDTLKHILIYIYIFYVCIYTYI